MPKHANCHNGYNSCYREAPHNKVIGFFAAAHLVYGAIATRRSRPGLSKTLLGNSRRWSGCIKKVVFVKMPTRFWICYFAVNQLKPIGVLHPGI